MIQALSDRTDYLRSGVDSVRAGKRKQHKLTDWFFVQECRMKHRQTLIDEGMQPESPMFAAKLLCGICRDMPLSLPDGTAVAGSQDGAFSPSYALINPSFKVEEFAGYCNPTAMYDDISAAPELGLTQERIDRVRAYWQATPYVQKLQQVYSEAGDDTSEVAYFMEPVTGHTIPDMRPFIREGVAAMKEKAEAQGGEYASAMAVALEAPMILGSRYSEIAREKLSHTTDAGERDRLTDMVDVLERVPEQGCQNLQEAIQMFVLLWQSMVIEQAPNPYAFSVGNLDRILAPYFNAADTSRESAVELVRHLLTFFQVGDRCWAISQNIMVGGKGEDDRDLTSEMTSIVLDAFFNSNDPQPALSVKVHRNTPTHLIESLGRFFFTNGHSTPSLFNDDSLFTMLANQSVEESDLPDYSIAGCQEPLIMGKASLNTTNSWLNLAKILELACNDGRSLISDKQIGPSWKELGIDSEEAAFEDMETTFWLMLDHFLPRMERGANACTDLLGEYCPVPLTSSLMDSFNSWRDMRDPQHPGTRYNASGCLLHGLSVIGNSLHALKQLAHQSEWKVSELRQALKDDFANSVDLRSFLLAQEKFGNDCAEIDELTGRIARTASEKIAALTNSAGNSFLADWSTPSTHLLYGYWVGATPDGRHARSMLGYGIDPIAGSTEKSLPDRILSSWRLPYHAMTGGYASHFGVQPQPHLRKLTVEEKGQWLWENAVSPLFRLDDNSSEAPFYIYFNIDSSNHLKAVLEDPETHAPDGIYIMRIHGTFVNFLDLSPAIQEDIIERLDLSEKQPA